MIKHKKIILKILVIIIVCLATFSETYAIDTEYIDEKNREYKGIGVAVIEEKNANTKKYYYLYYDDTGRVHILQYIKNELRTNEKARWIFKTDADTAKAKELGAKEYYTTEEEIQKDENKDATKLYNEIVKENKVGHLYDYVEGSEEDLGPVNIEDVIFNNISIFDVNVFSDTAGGKPVKDDSIVGILRTVIATWYVAFRNVAFVVIAILIIYYGIRLAISTIAEQKANYKRLLIGWIKSFILILFLHWIMYIILYFNDYLINQMDAVNHTEGAIYNTIRTRTFAFPWAICIPATIIYITLFVMLIRFIWVYIKRTFSVMFLIILAPLVITRYAIESASGKGSDMVVNWIKKFFTAVFIQSIHAMAYVIFVGPVIIHSLDNLLGFVTALFFLNFMLTADQVFVNVFKSNFVPKHVENLDKKFDVKENLAEILAARRLGGIAVGAVKGAGKVAVGGIGAGYRGAMNYANRNIDPNFQSNFESEVHDTMNNLEDNTFRRFNNFVSRHTQENDGKLPQNKPLRNIVKRGRTGINKMVTAGNNLLDLKKVIRKGGKTGAYAEKFLKLKMGEYGRRFTCPFKYVKDVAIGVGEIILVIPMTVMEPELGITLIAKIPSRFKKAKTVYETNEKLKEKQSSELDNAINIINNANVSAEKIEEMYDQLSETDQKIAKKQLKQVEKFGIDNYNLKGLILEAMKHYNIKEIDEDDIDNIVSYVVEQLPDDISDSKKATIRATAVQIITQQANAESRNARHIDTTEIPDYEDDSSNTSYNYDGQDNSSNTNTSHNDAQRRENTQNRNDDNQPRNTRENTSDTNNDTNNSSASNSQSREDNSNDIHQEERPKYDFAGIIQGIQEATIQETIDNKFLDMAVEVNNISSANKGGLAGEEVEIININRFIDSL